MVISRAFLLLVSTARVFLLIPHYVGFDFPSLPASASQGWISFLMWLVCGPSQTRGTWVDGFFPGAVWFVIGGFFMP